MEKTTSWRNDDDFDSFSLGEIMCASCAALAFIAIYIVASLF